MRIAILDLTGHPSPLLDGLPMVGQQIIDWLAPSLPEAEFDVAHVAHGDALPEAASFDGVVVSGSEKGVYDDTPWMTPLRTALKDWRDANKAIFGICFGHQIMADTFGGRAAKAPVGMVVGAREFEVDGHICAAHAWHQDQVIEAPGCATVIGRASHCPVGALRYDFPALSVQFHPEYSQSQLEALFQRGEGLFITPEDVARARASFREMAVSNDLMASEAAEFFRAHCATM